MLQGPEVGWERPLQDSSGAGATGGPAAWEADLVCM